MTLTAQEWGNIVTPDTLCYDNRTVIDSQEHNNANVLCLGGPLHDAGQLCDMAKTWLQTRFGGGRHMVRVNKISALERQ